MKITRKEKLGLLTLGVILICVLSGIYFSHKDNKTVEVIKSNTSTETQKTDNKEIKAYICGEIKKPGVYTLFEGDRLVKLIELAGGFSEKADMEAINMAMKVKDEDFIRVPEKGSNALQSNNSLKSDNVVKNVAPSNGENLININTSDKESLKTLPGIGDAISQRIIDYREKNGFFKNIDDIKNVSGIGDKVFERIKDQITI